MQPPTFFLFDYEIAALQTIAADRSLDRLLREQAQALLLLADGVPINIVAERSELSLPDLEHLAHVFLIRLDLPPLQRLQEAALLDAEPRKTQAVVQMLSEFHSQNPKLWSFPLSRWNVKLVQYYLQQRGITISRETLRKAVRRAAEQHGAL